MSGPAWAEETRRQYEMAGIGGRLAPGTRPAVLVVDLSNGFTDPACPTGSDLGDVVAGTRQLLDAARRAGHPCLFTTVAFAVDGIEGLVWRQKMPAMKVLEEGSHWAALDARLGRQAGEPLVVKRTASALAGTGVASMLAALRVDTVLLCGATTSGCIRATAVDLCQLGYPTFVPRDCVGDRAAGPHEASLFDMDAKYADVVGRDDALAILGR